MKTDIITDITLLYELSLSFGKSFDLVENCDNFLTTLMARKNLEFASVWIKNEFLHNHENESEGTVVYSNPIVRLTTISVPVTHSLFRIVENCDSLTIEDSHPDYHDLILEERTEKGVFILFKLGEIGVLKLFTSSKFTEYDELEINKLNNIITKFTLSVKGCLNHAKAIFDANNRIKLEKQNRILFNNNPVPMFIYNINTLTIMDVNSTFLFKYGYTKNEFLGKQVFDFIPKTSLPHNLIPKSDWHTSVSKTREWVHKLEDGTFINVEIMGSVIDYMNKPACIVLIHDITKRKNTQKAIKISNQNLSSFFNTSKDLLLVINSNLEILQVNDTFQKQVGYTQKETENKSILDFLISESSNKSKENIDKLICDKIDHCRFTILTKKTKPIPVEVYNSKGTWNDKEAFFIICKDISKLQLSEEKFEMLFQTSPALIALADYNTGKFIEVNNKFCDTFNYKRKEIIDHDFGRVLKIRKEERDILLENLTKTGEIRNNEITLSKKNGETIPVLYNAGIITIQNHKYIFLTAIDITTRKYAEEQLKHSERKYRRIFNSMIDVYSEIDYKTGVIVEISPSIYNISGYTREEIIGRKMEDFYLNSLERVKLYEQLSKTGNANDFEVNLVDSSGSIIPCSFSLNIEMDQNGNPHKVVGTMRNISDRKRAEESLAKLSTAIEQNPVAVVITDKKGKIEYINKSFTDITGYSFIESFAKNTNILKSDKNPPEIYSHMWATLEQGEIWRGEIINKKRSGILYNALLAISPIINEQGEVINYVGIQQDITFQKQLQIDLTTAKESAEAASFAKARFLANMSHEIRTPLNAITGLVNLLSETPLNPKQITFVSKLKDSSTNLLSIVNDVLDFSKIESGTLKIENTSFNISDIVKRLVNSMEQKAEERYNTINYFIEDRIPDILIGDPTRIYQILANLVSNAVKFTENGEITISITFIGKKDDKNILYISVKDTGIGIKEENLETIFQDFQQEDESTTRKYGGTGLGLAITQQLVELMGGELAVNSTPGEGSDFFFGIELLEGKKNEDDNRIKTQIDVNALKGIKVLYAEDNSYNQFIGKAILEKWNVDIHLANNGKEAIEMLKNDDFDIVLMDLQMPVMGGLEATGIIRNELNNNIPIIALTANVLVEIIENCKAVGMNDFLGKPFEQEELFNKITTSLNIIPNKITSEQISSTESSCDKQNVSEDISNIETFDIFSDKKLFKVDVLLNLFDNDDDMVDSLIKKFIEQTPETIEELINYLDDNDIDGIRKTAHKLKSSVKLLATPEINNAIKTIEQQAINEVDMKEFSCLIHTFVADVEKMINQLKEYVGLS